MAVVQRPCHSALGACTQGRLLDIKMVSAPHWLFATHLAQPAAPASASPSPARHAKLSQWRSKLPAQPGTAGALTACTHSFFSFPLADFLPCAQHRTSRVAPACIITQTLSAASAPWRRGASLQQGSAASRRRPVQHCDSTCKFWGLLPWEKPCAVVLGLEIGAPDICRKAYVGEVRVVKYTSCCVQESAPALLSPLSTPAPLLCPMVALPALL